jgi:hypothetical protein
MVMAVVGTSMQPVEPGRVVLRGTGETAAGEPSAVDAQGVTVVLERDASGRASRTSVVGWDRVREVRGPLAGEAAKFAEISEAAFRARVRLERGDVVSAEPLYERLFREYRGKSGGLSASIAAGLLRCRLSRGAQASAVEAWVESLRGPGGVVADVVDAGTGLCPGLPPMWLASPAVASLASSVELGGEGSKDRAGMLGRLYVSAARREMGLSELEGPGGTSEPGVRLVMEIVRSRSEDAGKRQEARRELGERLDSKSPEWMQAWARVAIGRSLLMEEDAEKKREGVISLLYVASRGAEKDAYLGGVALASAALGLESLGDSRGASLLAAELAERYADHPALDAPAMQRWVVGREKAGSRGVTKERQNP